MLEMAFLPIPKEKESRSSLQKPSERLKLSKKQGTSLLQEGLGLTFTKQLFLHLSFLFLFFHLIIKDPFEIWRNFKIFPATVPWPIGKFKRLSSGLSPFILMQ